MNPTVASWRVNPKIPIALGSSIAIVGLLLTTQVHSFSLFLFTYAAVVGMGIGFCYFPPLQCGWEWVEKKDLVTGVILGAFGFGSFVFSFMSKYMCNPSNDKPIEISDGRKFYSKDVASNVPGFFMTMAVCWFVLAAIAVVLVRKNPELRSEASQTDFE